MIQKVSASHKSATHQSGISDNVDSENEQPPTFMNLMIDA